MTNRQRLLKKNPYDVLLQMNTNINTHSTDGSCIMDALIGDDQEVSDRCLGINGCDKCIQNWLNEEEK